MGKVCEREIYKRECLFIAAIVAVVISHSCLYPKGPDNALTSLGWRKNRKESMFAPHTTRPHYQHALVKAPSTLCSTGWGNKGHTQVARTSCEGGPTQSHKIPQNPISAPAAVWSLLVLVGAVLLWRQKAEVESEEAAEIQSPDSKHEAPARLLIKTHFQN